ncbi:DUF397 domain-containing protein [Streptomyces sp. NBC_00523]|uniref:DUF397 domain-containing protein n=1 Tax=Streptomyces sp. NBC_00523 TaxID=2975765 RepID=UPI002E814ABD|nr:DUF397 domain-containing protein [Streptomyces sp. NBC_00523]
MRGARLPRRARGTPIHRRAERPVAVRDSKRAAGPVLVLKPTAWAAFHAALRRP